MFGWLSAVDLMAPAFNITFKGDESLKTKPGALLSLIYLTCLGFCCLIFIRGFFDISTPYITEYQQSTEKDFRLNVAENGMLPVFKVWSWKEGRFLNASEIVTKLTFFIAYANLNNSEDTYSYTGNISTSLTCEEISKNGNFNYPEAYENYEEIKTDLHQKAVCFNITNSSDYFMNGTRYQHLDRNIIIRGAKCFGREDCETLNVNDVEIDIVFPQSKTDINDRRKPYRPSLNLDDYTRVYEWKFNNIFLYKSKVKSVYDAPWFFGENKLVSSFPDIIEDIQEKKYERNFHYLSDDSYDWAYDYESCDDLYYTARYWCHSLFMIEHKIVPVETVYTRKYSTPLDLLSEIGGVASLLMPVFLFLNGIFLAFGRKKVLATKVFPVLKHVDKSKGSKFLGSLYNDATEVVDSYFDIANIFQDLSCLKLLIHLLLDEDQQKLASLYPLHHFHKTREETALKKKEEKNRSKEEKKLKSARGDPAFTNLGIKMKALKPKKQIEQIASLALLLSKQRKKPTEVQSLTFDQQLHGYIDKQVDHMLMNSMESLGIQAPSSQVKDNPFKMLINRQEPETTPISPRQQHSIKPAHIEVEHLDI
jgi:hypothetical protein